MLFVIGGWLSVLSNCYVRILNPLDSSIVIVKVQVAVGTEPAVDSTAAAVWPVSEYSGKTQLMIQYPHYVSTTQHAAASFLHPRHVSDV